MSFLFFSIKNLLRASCILKKEDLVDMFMIVLNYMLTI